MAGFNVGAFAGGVGAGIEQGQAIRERYQQQIEKQRVDKANALAFQVMSGGADKLAQGGGAPPAPAPGGQPPQGPPQGPALGTPTMSTNGLSVPPPPPPPGGGQPSPSPQGVPRPMPMPGVQPMNPPPGGPPPGGPPPGGPPPGGPPPGQPAPPTQGAAPAPGGQAGPNQDPESPFYGVDVQKAGQQYKALTDIAHQHYKDTLQSVVQQMKQSGQKPDPLAAMKAADVILEKQALDPDLKALIQANAGMTKAQMQFMLGSRRADQGDEKITETAKKDEEAHGDRQAALKTSLQRVAMAQSGADRRAQLGAATKLQAENIIQAGSNGRTQAVIDARQAAQDAGLNEKEWQTQLEAQLKEEGMDSNFVSKLFAASPTGKAPSAPVRKPLPSAPRRGGGGSSGGGGGAKPLPAATLAQWKQVPPANRAAAKQHLQSQGYDVSGLQ